MSPYICGMYAANKYLKGEKYPSKKLEWASVFGILVVSVLGATPTIGEFYMHPLFNTI